LITCQRLLPRAACVLAYLTIGIALAQNPTATLVGTVRDGSGAVVTGALLEVRNTGTGSTRTAASDEKGDFTVPNLVPGPYAVTVSKPGFRSVRETNMVLELDQIARMQFKLEVGATAQSVEVTTDAPLINTENGTKGEVMAANEIVEMPLNGRSINDLAVLAPGVIPNTTNIQGSSFAVNGARPDNTNFVFEGFGITELFGGAALITPSLDAVQEFKMLTNNFSAEYGRLAGGVMSTVLKTGGNQVHGSLFEFVRNNDVDARNFFAQNNPELRQNQFGGVFSGPVRIPKVYNGHDRTFFLFSWEGYRQVQGSPTLGVVPTSAQRAGNFSQTGPISDPLSTGTCPGSTGKGACFPGDVIPESRLSPQAVAAQAFYPLPNLTGLNNMAAYTVAPNKYDTLILKFDQRISSNNTLSFRYTTTGSYAYNAYINPVAANANNTGLFGQQSNNRVSLAGLTDTHLFSPTLINEFRLAFDRNGGIAYGAPGNATNYNAQFGIPGLTTNPLLIGFPEIYPSGYQQLGPGNNYPAESEVDSWPAGDTLTWVKGSHLIKAGMDVVHNQTEKIYANNARGTFETTGYWTGQSYADFLLGYLSSASRLVGDGTANHLLSTSYGTFFEDDWKVFSRLTLNLGLRWEVDKPPVDSAGRLSNFIPSLNGGQGELVIASTNTLQGTGIGFTNPALVTTAAQADLPQSLVYTNYRDFAPRFGFAWRPFGGNRTVLRGGYGIFYGGQVLNPVRTALGDIFPFVVTQSNNRSTTNPLALTLANPFPTAPNLVENLASITLGGMELHPPSPYLQSWNLTIERELGFSSALKVSYVGSKGTHFALQDNINQPYNRSAALPGGILPYPSFGTISDFFNYESNSIYNGLIVTWQRRFVHGFFFNANYTYSKSIDDSSSANGASTGGITGLQNTYCLSCDRGRSDWDIGHVFTATFSWEVPLHNVFLRGWQIASNDIFHTGQPFTPVVTNSNVNLGEAIRPNRIGNGTVPNPSVAQWFNVSDFPEVPEGAFTFGNAGRNILDGPGLMNVNLSLFKNFVVREGTRLQFRWEVFNVFNHANFGLPENAVNAANAGTLLSAGSPREMQFALRLSY
jgi:hypothetical protein